MQLSGRAILEHRKPNTCLPDEPRESWMLDRFDRRS